MANKNEPLVKLEPGGKAPILRYDVPEPTSYSGRNTLNSKYHQTISNQALVKNPIQRSEKQLRT